MNCIKARLISFCLIIIFSHELIFNPAFGRSNLKIRSLLGASFCGKKVLKKGESLPDSCKLETQASSNIYLENSNEVIAFGENSEVSFLNNSTIEMVVGIARFKVKDKLNLKTPSASVQLENGDFLVRISRFFNEVEVVNFTGKSDLFTENKTKDFVQISSGQWGGVGGRFGIKIGDLLNLNENQIKVFKKLLD